MSVKNAAHRSYDDLEAMVTLSLTRGCYLSGRVDAFEDDKDDSKVYMID